MSGTNGTLVTTLFPPLARFQQRVGWLLPGLSSFLQAEEMSEVTRDAEEMSCETVTWCSRSTAQHNESCFLRAIHPHTPPSAGVLLACSKGAESEARYGSSSVQREGSRG